MWRWKTLVVTAWVVMVSITGAHGKSIQTGQGQDERLFWHWRHEGLSIRLTQLQPNQVRAFFLARGIDRAAVERLAATCLFQMELYNEGANSVGPVRVPLAHWTLKSRSVQRALMSAKDWMKRWEDIAIAKPARIAFRWALFPAEQTFHAGDRNWGMLSTGLENGVEFDLELKWLRSGELRTSRINKMRCAGEE